MLRPYLVTGACGFIGSNFESALADTVRWYVDNEPWWTDVFERKGELQINWA